MISVLKEPTGDTYRLLIEYAAKRCSTVVLVVDSRRGKLNEKGIKVLEKLKPYLIKRIKNNN